jgi:DNA-binding winged helix-turn-helix (wHTH) protein/lipoprotein NlpI
VSVVPIDSRYSRGSSQIYCFGEFRFDVSRRLLFRGVEVTPIPERLALLLTELVEARGALVSKEALAESLWPHEAVTDGNLAQHVYMLRRLLGERARDHAYILSVSGSGYRFALPVVNALPLPNEPAAVDPATLGDALLHGGVDAFRNYCQGSFFVEHRTAPSIRRAIDFFEASLATNPKYVPALIGLARSHSLLAEYWHAPPNLAFPRARKAIAQALALDSTSALAHAVRCGILCFSDWDWNGAQEEIDLAIRINPGSTFVRNNAAWLYVCTGRYTHALQQAQYALVMEPSSLPLQLVLARVLVHAGDYSNAVALMSSLLDTDPAFYIARRYRAQAYLLNSQPEKAVSDLELLPQEHSEDPSFRLPMLGRAYADLGERDRADKILSTLRSMAATDYVVRWNLAIVAIGLGRLEEAMAYLETAYEQREATLPFLKSLPWFEPISGSRRFRDLLRKIGPAHPVSRQEPI